jgi:hypothetical protein
MSKFPQQEYAMKNKANLMATYFFKRKWEGAKQNVLVPHDQIYWGDETESDHNVLLLFVSKKFWSYASLHTMKNDTQMAVNILKYTGHLECEILQNKL